MSAFNEKSSWIDSYKTKYTTPYEDLMDAVNREDKELVWDYLLKTDISLEDYLTDTFTEEGIEDIKDDILWYSYQVLQYGETDQVELHRVIFLDINQEIDTTDLGLCWSADEEGAYYFLEFCDRPKVVYLKAHTSRDNINWAVSIGQNIRCPNEHELRVIEEDKIVLDDVVEGDLEEIEKALRC